MKNITNTRNENGVKDSANCYRNIKGVFFEHRTSDASMFTNEKEGAFKSGLKFRVISGEFYRETK